MLSNPTGYSSASSRCAKPLALIGKGKRKSILEAHAYSPYLVRVIRDRHDGVKRVEAELERPSVIVKRSSFRVPSVIG